MYVVEVPFFQVLTLIVLEGKSGGGDYRRVGESTSSLWESFKLCSAPCVAGKKMGDEPLKTRWTFEVNS